MCGGFKDQQKSQCGCIIGSKIVETYYLKIQCVLLRILAFAVSEMGHKRSFVLFYFKVY